MFPWHSYAPRCVDVPLVGQTLSGRQMKRGRESTAPALLAGLGVLLAMLAVLDEHSVEELRRFKEIVRQQAKGSPHDVTAALLRAVEAHWVESAYIRDDFALLVANLAG